MYSLFILGTAGSGKSTLAYSFSEWLKDQEQSCINVNLDPAVITLPYEPDIDIRDYIDYERIMAERGLGPNAALIASLREFCEEIDNFKEEIESYNVDYCIIDTPGQLELFAFRKEGEFLANNLVPFPKGIIFLIDPVFCSSPKNLIASLFLSTSVYIVFNLPTILALSKSDSLDKEKLNRIINWFEEKDRLLLDINSSLKGLSSAISFEIASAILEIINSLEFIPVSSFELTGFTELHAAITRMLGEGEIEIR